MNQYTGYLPDFECFKTSELPDMMAILLANFVVQTGLTPTLARTFLIKNMWNQEKAIDDFLSDEQGGVEAILGFQMRNENEPIQFEEYCPVCYEEYGEDDWMYIQECGHYLCKDCYREYLLEHLSHGASVAMTCCPNEECKILVPPRIFEELLEPAQF